MNFDIFCASVRFNMASSWLKFAEVGDKLAQVGCKLTASWPKLVPRRPKRSPDAAMQARSSFHFGILIRISECDPQREAASSRQVAGK